jgi:hypothetical protein
MKRTVFLSLLFTLLCTCALAQGTRAAAETKLDEVYPAYNLTGAGTLVVMIDRGIDYHHPAYLKPDGTTRLAYVFDMINGDDGNQYGVGQVLNAAQINIDLSTGGPPQSNDNHGHGTATTGIIAGNGAGSNGSNDFIGVAPEATIISIKLVQDGFPAGGGSPGETGFFNPDYIALALQFAEDKIAELGLPAVTLMNIGSIGGPTDGSSSVGRAIADFATNHTFVCGVGDDGGANNVARGNVTQTADGVFTDIRIEKLTEGNLDVDLWYDADDRFEARIILPDGGQLIPGVPNNGTRTSETGENTTVWHNGANVDFYGSTGNRREVFTRISSGTGIYTIRLTHITVNDGSFIATMNPAHIGLNNSFLDFGTNDGSINDYSASPGVISPSDYVFAPTFMSVDGNTYGGGQGAPGEIWTGSSKGPTQDGRLGIDFAAPGEVLFGPYSSGSFYSRAISNQVAGGNNLYGIQNAVSASAPLTTGIIALMLEMDPTLTPPEVLAILQNTARSDGFTGNTPNNTWGQGKIDAKAALDEVNRIVGTEEVNPINKQVWLSPNPAKNIVRIVTSDGVEMRNLRVYDVAGREVLWANDIHGEIDISSLVGGSYLFRCTTDGGVVTKSLVKL